MLPFVANPSLKIFHELDLKFEKNRRFFYVNRKLFSCEHKIDITKETTKDRTTKINSLEKRSQKKKSHVTSYRKNVFSSFFIHLCYTVLNYPSKCNKVYYFCSKLRNETKFL